MPLINAPVAREGVTDISEQIVVDAENEMRVISDDMLERPIAEGHPLQGEFLCMSVCFCFDLQ